MFFFFMRSHELQFVVTCSKVQTNNVNLLTCMSTEPSSKAVSLKLKKNENNHYAPQLFKLSLNKKEICTLHFGSINLWLCFRGFAK